MKKFLGEFKNFAMRGNVMDMAVGVVVGGAFSAIITSLVNNIITPIIGLLLGNVDFSTLSITIPSAVEGVEPSSIMYGAFIQSVIDFLIIAFCVFAVVKAINKLHKKKEEPAPEPAPAPEPEPTKEELLLTEIRDLLKERQ